MLKAKVTVTLKKDVSDPQGLAVTQALKSLHFDGVQDVRVGKYFEITLDGLDREAAEKQLDEMSDKVLSNPVIEDYHFEIVEG